MSDDFNRDDRCPGCGLTWWLFPPARIDESVVIDGRSTFRPGPDVRCVECKRVYSRPEQTQDATP